MGRSGHAQRRVQRRAAQSIWRAAARISGVVGLVCALWTWDPSGSLAAVIALMVLVSAAAVLAGARGVRQPLWFAFLVSVGVLATAGFLAAFGWAGAAWLGFLVATAPLTRILLTGAALRSAPGSPLRWDPTILSHGGRPAGRDLDLLEPAGSGSLHSRVELPDAEGLAALDDQGICVAWRRSFLQLGGATPPARRLEVVRLRQLYLDELGRRHPVGLRRWLDSGARAAGNPLPFLEDRCTRSPATGDQTDDAPRGP